ncbi:MAG: ester cyclase [Actinomycetia bacterium]|nr:ester cyclase [Actinomycetes bacterium]
MSASRSEEVMRRYLTEVLGEKRFDLIPGFVADDMIDHTQSITGPAALDAHARGFCANIPDVEIEVVQIIATDDAAVGIWRWQGTAGQPMGMSAGGSPIYPHLVASVFQFRDGMLVDYHPFVDAVEARAQIIA